MVEKDFWLSSGAWWDRWRSVWSRLGPAATCRGTVVARWDKFLAVARWDKSSAVGIAGFQPAGGF